MGTTLQRHRYTDLEKQELIEQWKASGKAKSTFCKEKSIGYFSFCEWVRGRKRKHWGKGRNSFLPVKIKNSVDSIFIQVILKNGTTVNIYQKIETNYLVTILNA